MIERIDLHDDGVHCTVSGDGFEIVTTVPNVTARSRWERVYGNKMNRVWMGVGDHRAVVDKLLREAAMRRPVAAGVPDITRAWVLDYCRIHHRARAFSIKDAPFHRGAALFDGQRYIVKWASLLDAARKAGWQGSTARFADLLRKAGMVSLGNTSVGKRQCRPWAIVLDERELERVRAV